MVPAAALSSSIPKVRSWVKRTSSPRAGPSRSGCRTWPKRSAAHQHPQFLGVELPLQRHGAQPDCTPEVPLVREAKVVEYPRRGHPRCRHVGVDEASPRSRRLLGVSCPSSGSSCRGSSSLRARRPKQPTHKGPRSRSRRGLYIVGSKLPAGLAHNPTAPTTSNRDDPPPTVLIVRDMPPLLVERPSIERPHPWRQGVTLARSERRRATPRVAEPRKGGTRRALLGGRGRREPRIGRVTLPHTLNRARCAPARAAFDLAADRVEPLGLSSPRSAAPARAACSRRAPGPSRRSNWMRAPSTSMHVVRRRGSASSTRCHDVELDRRPGSRRAARASRTSSARRRAARASGRRRSREDLEQAQRRVDRVVEAEVAVGEEDVAAHLAGEQRAALPSSSS